MKKLLSKTLAILVFSVVLLINISFFSFSGTISDINTYNNIGIHNAENMSPSISFQTQKPRLVDINYFNVYQSSSDATLSGNIASSLTSPLNNKAIDNVINLNQVITPGNSVLNYIKGATWRAGTERYFIYQNTNLASDFSNQNNFKLLQNFCEQNGIKLVSISSLTNSSSISNTFKTLSNSYSYDNTNIQNTLNKISLVITCEKTSDIFINVGENNYSNTQIQNAIEAYLKPKILNSNITANINTSFNYTQSGYNLKYFTCFGYDSGVAINTNNELYKWEINNNYSTSATVTAALVETGVKSIGYSYTNSAGIVLYKLNTDGKLYKMPPYDETVSDALYFASGALVASNIETLDGIASLVDLQASGNYSMWNSYSLHGSSDFGWLPWWNLAHGKTKTGATWCLDKTGNYQTKTNPVYIPTIYLGYGIHFWDGGYESALDRGKYFTFYTDSSNVPYMYVEDASGNTSNSYRVRAIQTDGKLHDVNIVRHVYRGNTYYFVDSTGKYYVYGYDNPTISGYWYYEQYPQVYDTNGVSYRKIGYGQLAKEDGYYGGGHLQIGGTYCWYLTETGTLTDDSYNFSPSSVPVSANSGTPYYWSYKITPPSNIFGVFKTNNNLLNYIKNINSSSNNVFAVDITNNLRTEDTTACANALKSLSSYYVGINSSSSHSFTDSIISSNNNNGLYISDSDINTAMSGLADYIISNVKAPIKSTYMLINEQCNYLKNYTDPEADSCVEETWNYKHDDQYFTNSLGKITDATGIYTGTANGALDGINISSPIFSFDKTGKYHIGVRSRDNPNPIRAEISRFGDWTYQDVIVNRRPISDFTYTATYDTASGRFIPSFVDYSYDLDHSNLISKGIVQWVWKWRLSSDIAWTIGKPAYLNTASSYDISLEALDLEGYWSYPKIVTISTANIPPDILANPSTIPLSETPITVTLTGTDPESYVKNIKWSVTNSAIKPETYAYATSNYSGVKKASLSQNVTISNAGTWFINAQVEDQSGNKTDKSFGPYVVQTFKISNFTVNMIYDLNWHSYYFDESTGIDTNNDGEVDSYTQNSSTDIKTPKMPINNPKKVDSSISVKAGVKTEGYVDILGNPDTAYFKSKYWIDGVLKEDVITLEYYSVTGHYYWSYTIPKDTDQDSFIYFDVYAVKEDTTYSNEKWADTWDVANLEHYVFYVEGSVMDSLRVHQSN